jgi:sugar/nucleoside kinase (ribokinase family)
MPRAPADLVIFGSIGLDDITTPFGKVKSVLGGSAAYSAISASNFSQCAILGVVGNDFPESYLEILKSKNINLDGLKVSGKTFRWKGKYEFDMSEAQTLEVKLNSLSEFIPEIPKNLGKTQFLFLANNDPETQISIAKCFPKAFKVIDTMNYYITSKREFVLKAMKLADMVVLNESETRQLSREVNLVKAAKLLLVGKTEYVIVKKGENGALFFSRNSCFSAPGYPLEKLKDPTGAGDTFGGALIGYLTQSGKTDENTIRKAVVYGCTLASFCSEDFSVNRLANLNNKEIEARYEEFKELRRF